MHRMGFDQIIGCSIISKVIAVTTFPYCSLSYILDFVKRTNHYQMGFQLHSSVVKFRIIDHILGSTNRSRPSFLHCSCHTDFTTFHRSLVITAFAKQQKPYQVRIWASLQVVITQLGLPIIAVQEGQMDQSWPKRLSKLNY